MIQKAYSGKHADIPLPYQNRIQRRNKYALAAAAVALGTAVVAAPGAAFAATEVHVQGANNDTVLRTGVTVDSDGTAVSAFANNFRYDVEYFVDNDNVKFDGSNYFGGIKLYKDGEVKEANLIDTSAEGFDVHTLSPDTVATAEYLIVNKDANGETRLYGKWQGRVVRNTSGASNIYLGFKIASGEITEVRLVNDAGEEYTSGYITAKGDIIISAEDENGGKTGKCVILNENGEAIEITGETGKDLNVAFSGAGNLEVKAYDDDKHDTVQGIVISSDKDVFVNFGVKSENEAGVYDNTAAAGEADNSSYMFVDAWTKDSQTDGIVINALNGAATVNVYKELKVWAGTDNDTGDAVTGIKVNAKNDATVTGIYDIKVDVNKAYTEGETTYTAQSKSGTGIEIKSTDKNASLIMGDMADLNVYVEAIELAQGVKVLANTTAGKAMFDTHDEANIEAYTTATKLTEGSGKVSSGTSIGLFVEGAEALGVISNGDDSTILAGVKGAGDDLDKGTNTLVKTYAGLDGDSWSRGVLIHAVTADANFLVNGDTTTLDVGVAANDAKGIMVVSGLKDNAYVGRDAQLRIMNGATVNTYVAGASAIGAEVKSADQAGYILEDAKALYEIGAGSVLASGVVLNSAEWTALATISNDSEITINIQPLKNAAGQIYPAENATGFTVKTDNTSASKVTAEGAKFSAEDSKVTVNIGKENLYGATNAKGVAAYSNGYNAFVGFNDVTFDSKIIADKQVVNISSNAAAAKQDPAQGSEEKTNTATVLINDSTVTTYGETSVSDPQPVVNPEPQSTPDEVSTLEENTFPAHTPTEAAGILVGGKSNIADQKANTADVVIMGDSNVSVSSKSEMSIGIGASAKDNANVDVIGEGVDETSLEIKSRGRSVSKGIVTTIFETDQASAEKADAYSGVYFSAVDVDINAVGIHDAASDEWSVGIDATSSSSSNAYGDAGVIITDGADVTITAKSDYDAEAIYSSARVGDVKVTIDDGSKLSGTVEGDVYAEGMYLGSRDGDVDLTANDATVTIKATSTTGENSVSNGIDMWSYAGDVTITADKANLDFDITGKSWANGIVTQTGDEVYDNDGKYLYTKGGGSITVEAKDSTFDFDVTSLSNEADGIDAYAYMGAANVKADNSTFDFDVTSWAAATSDDDHSMANGINAQTKYGDVNVSATNGSKFDFDVNGMDYVNGVLGVVDDAWFNHDVTVTVEDSVLDFDLNGSNADAIYGSTAKGDAKVIVTDSTLDLDVIGWTSVADGIDLDTKQGNVGVIASGSTVDINVKAFQDSNGIVLDTENGSATVSVSDGALITDVQSLVGTADGVDMQTIYGSGNVAFDNAQVDIDVVGLGNSNGIKNRNEAGWFDMWGDHDVSVSASDSNVDINVTSWAGYADGIDLKTNRGDATVTLENTPAGFTVKGFLDADGVRMETESGSVKLSDTAGSVMTDLIFDIQSLTGDAKDIMGVSKYGQAEVEFDHIDGTLGAKAYAGDAKGIELTNADAWFDWIGQHDVEVNAAHSEIAFDIEAKSDATGIDLSTNRGNVTVSGIEDSKYDFTVKGGDTAGIFDLATNQGNVIVDAADTAMTFAAASDTGSVTAINAVTNEGLIDITVTGAKGSISGTATAKGDATVMDLKTGKGITESDEKSAGDITIDAKEGAKIELTAKSTDGYATAINVYASYENLNGSGDLYIGAFDGSTFKATAESATGHATGLDAHVDGDVYVTSSAKSYVEFAATGDTKAQGIDIDANGDVGMKVKNYSQLIGTAKSNGESNGLDVGATGDFNLTISDHSYGKFTAQGGADAAENVIEADGDAFVNVELSTMDASATTKKGNGIAFALNVEGDAGFTFKDATVNAFGESYDTAVDTYGVGLGAYTSNGKASFSAENSTVRAIGASYNAGYGIDIEGVTSEVVITKGSPVYASGYGTQEGIGLYAGPDTDKDRVSENASVTVSNKSYLEATGSSSKGDAVGVFVEGQQNAKLEANLSTIKADATGTSAASGIRLNTYQGFIPEGSDIEQENAQLIVKDATVVATGTSAKGSAFGAEVHADNASVSVDNSILEGYGTGADDSYAKGLEIMGRESSKLSVSDLSWLHGVADGGIAYGVGVQSFGSEGNIDVDVSLCTVDAEATGVNYAYGVYGFGDNVNVDVKNATVNTKGVASGAFKDEPDAEGMYIEAIVDASMKFENSTIRANASSNGGAAGVFSYAHVGDSTIEASNGSVLQLNAKGFHAGALDATSDGGNAKVVLSDVHGKLVADGSDISYAAGAMTYAADPTMTATIERTNGTYLGDEQGEAKYANTYTDKNDGTVWSNRGEISAWSSKDIDDARSKKINDIWNLY